MGADPTTLFRGTVLQTAEFADSLYSPLFVSSLYHILIDLSRLFFFGYRLSSDELGMGLTTTEEKFWSGKPSDLGDFSSQTLFTKKAILPEPLGVGIVSCIIPYYFNPWGTGSHLYSANTNTLRSGHWVEVLLTLVGLPSLGVALPSPFVPLLYHTLRGLSRTFLRNFCST